MPSMGEVYPYLKSNMDRFIESMIMKLSISIEYLKSNMDRFIVYPLFLSAFCAFDLKSNMDRFIGLTV